MNLNQPWDLAFLELAYGKQSPVHLMLHLREEGLL